MGSPLPPEPNPLLALARRLVGVRRSATVDPLAPLADPYVPPSGLVDTLSTIAGRRPKGVGVSGRDLHGDLGRYTADRGPDGSVQDTVFISNTPDARRFTDPTVDPGTSRAQQHLNARFGHPLAPDDILAHEFGHVAQWSPYSELPDGAWGIRDSEEFADEFAKAVRNLRAGREVVPSRIPLEWMQQQAARTYEVEGAMNPLRKVAGKHLIARR